MKEGIIFFIFCIVVVSCKIETNNELINNKTIEICSFPLTKELKGEKIDIEILGLHEITVADTFLIGFDYRGRDNFMHVYSTNTLDYLGSLIKKGRGPNEILTLTYVGQYDIDNLGCHLWISDNAIFNKTYKLNVTKSLKEKSTVFDTCLVFKNCPFSYRYKLNDSIFAGFVFGNTSNVDFFHYNINKCKVNSSVKMYKKDFPNAKYADIYKSLSMQISSDNKYFVVSSSRLNKIHIFPNDFSKALSLSVSEINYSIKEMLKREYEEQNLTYGDIAVSEDYIFVIYLNKSLNDLNKEGNSSGKELHVFRWTGEPVMKINILEDIRKICIDEKHKYVYANTVNEEIYRYDLNGVLK